MEQKMLVQKLLEASNKVHQITKSGSPKASYIHLSEQFLQKEADRRGVSIEELVKTISTKTPM